MSKRNVAFIKPSEPAFLTRLKQQAGYKEGPTVDTKKGPLPTCHSSDESDGEDQPQIVVLKAGDLTQEEVEIEKKESENAKANLDQRVVFKRPEKSSEISLEKQNRKRPAKETPRQDKKHQKVVLSFSDQEESDSEGD